MTSGVQSLPFINVRDLVVVPGMEMILLIGREVSVKAIEQVLRSDDQHLVVISQKQPEQYDIGLADMYSLGTLCKIEKSVRMDEAMKIFVVGQSRFKVSALDEASGVRMVFGQELPTKNDAAPVLDSDRNEIETLVKTWCSKFQGQANHPSINRLAAPAGHAPFFARVMEIISSSELDKKSPEKTLIRAAKQGLRQNIQKNSDGLMRRVADRQSLLEESDLSRVPSLLKELLNRELQDFA